LFFSVVDWVSMMILFLHDCVHVRLPFDEQKICSCVTDAIPSIRLRLRTKRRFTRTSCPPSQLDTQHFESEMATFFLPKSQGEPERGNGIKQSHLLNSTEVHWA